ncbi:hypothetical protein N657DRAFT_688346 [Parathielavia appendiculata]|uniref:Uncharacterized protein n=1 Tax=Parathielavia appendiculata TaxID=2587402 RepID=A0AAN6U450_9PEZI|nr:hypothetical protein N657DRAFT_688346 [Parathielavia appendiculata]
MSDRHYSDPSARAAAGTSTNAARNGQPTPRCPVRRETSSLGSPLILEMTQETEAEGRQESWTQQIQPQTDAHDPAGFPQSEMPPLRGYRAAVYSLADWGMERRARGSRWFGPAGFFCESQGTRAVSSENVQDFDDNSAHETADSGAVINPTGTPFRPSRMRLVVEGEVPDAPRAPVRTMEALGVSWNYRGDILSGRIFRQIGRVYCTVISPPNQEAGWPTAAAKIVFFEEAAARRFWDFYGREGTQRRPFVVGGLTAIVERNRTRAMVNVKALFAEFTANFYFEMDEILVSTEIRHTYYGVQLFRTAEFRFGSFRAQSQNAFRLLNGRPGLSIRYGRDPCAL